MDILKITTVEKVNPRYHRSEVIIHRGMWYFAEFHNMKQLDDFMNFAGMTMKLKAERPCSFDIECGAWREYEVSHALKEEGYFTKRTDIPENAKSFKGLSNGSLVDCYLWNDGHVIHIYRPNPNSKDLYKPLSVEEHIKYCQEHGTI